MCGCCAQYRGENLSEVAAASALPKEQDSSGPGWRLPGFSTPVAAVFEKEIRYLLRSGPMLLTLIMPIFMLVIFRFGPVGSRAGRTGGLFAHTPDMAFPAAAAYTLFLLTNLGLQQFWRRRWRHPVLLRVAGAFSRHRAG